MFAVCVTRDSDPGLNTGKAKPLYDLLVTFADVSSRDTGQGYPYREALATCLDCSKQTVDRAADYLENEIGLVKIHRRKVEGKPDENDANLYEIFDAWLIHGMTPPKGTPPQLVARYGHVVPGLDIDAWVHENAPDFDLTAWRATYEAKLRAQEAKREEQRRKERARRKKSKRGGDVTDDATPEGGANEGGSVTGDASSDVTGDASGAVMGDALSRAGLPEPSSTDDEALAGRSPGERRRPTTGSREAEAEGDFVASSEDSSPGDGTSDGGSTGARGQSTTAAAGKAKLTPKEREVRDALLPLLPPDFRQALGNIIPTNVVQDIVKALAADQPRERTVQQLVQYRVMPRWERYWAAEFYAGKLTPELAPGKNKKPFGPLSQMLADTAECGNLSCEDRHDFVTADACQMCEMRKVDKRADRDRERQAPTGEPNTGSVDAGNPEEPPVPVQRRSNVAIHGRAPGRECEIDTCALPIPEDSDDTLCPRCRKSADDEAETARVHAALAARYEAPEPELAYSATAPF
jgi:hypothetical protein